MPEQRKLLAYLIPYVLMSSLQYQFAKDGLKYVDPMTFMGIRYFIAAAICFVIARNYRPILNRDTVLLSFFTFLSSAIWIYGLEYVSPAQSAVLSYTMPLFAIPQSVLLLKERVTPLVWTGAIVGFTGVAIYGLALVSSGGSILGAVLSFGNAFFWALYSVYIRKLRVQNPVRTVATQFFLGGIFFLPFIPFTFFLMPTVGFFVDLGYVSFIGGVLSLLVWSVMLRMETVGKITTLVFAVPATTVIIEAVLTGQLPTGASILGICVMFAGIYVSRLKSVNPTVTVSPVGADASDASG